MKMLIIKSILLVYLHLLAILNTVQTNQETVNDTETFANRSETYDAIIKDKDDVVIYEMNNFKEHLRNAKTINDAFESKLNNTLRYHYVDWYEAANVKYMYFANITHGLMQQSIYTTRERLQETRKYRQIFANDPAYRAGLIYVSLVQLKIKMDNIYGSLRNMKSDGNFVHAFILYERMIVASVDVETFVNQMFEIQEIYKGFHMRRD